MKSLVFASVVLLLLAALSQSVMAQQPATQSDVDNDVIFELSQASSVKKTDVHIPAKGSSSPVRLFDAGRSNPTVYLTEDFETPWTGTPAAPPGWTQTRVVNLGDGTPEGDATDGEKDWQRNVNTGVATWTINPSSTSPVKANAAVSGTGVLWMNDWNFGPTGTLGFGSRRMETPAMDLSASTSPYVRFWLFYPATTGSNNMRVMASSNGGATWTAIMVYTSNATISGTMVSATPYQRINVLIPPAYRTATSKIGLEFTNIYGTQNVWIDDLTVEDFTPTAIAAAATGNWSDTATWTGGVVPSADNDVSIPVGMTVTVDVNVARCQDLLVDGTLNFASTGSALQAFGNMTISGTGVYSAYNATTGKVTFLGGSFNNAGSVDMSVGTPTFWFTGGSASTFTNTGTLVNNRIGGTVLFANTAGITINSAVTMTGAISMVMGTVNPNANLTLGDPAVATTQTISVGRGSFSTAPTFAGGMTSRSVTYTQFFAQPQSATTLTTGQEIEDVGGTRTVTGTLTMTTYNNVALGFPVTVGTSTTGTLTLTRGILITTPANLLTLETFVTGASGTAPSIAALPTTHGSFISGPMRINFPASTLTTRNFALGVGTAFNGSTPNSNVLKTLNLGLSSGTWGGQTITASIEAAPSGSANAPLTAVMGTRSYRLNLNGGPDLPPEAFITVRGRNSTYGNSDNMIGAIPDLRVAQSTAVTGPWTERSATSGSGSFVDNTDYARTTATAAPGPIGPLGTNGQYFALATTANLMVYDSSAAAHTDTTPVLIGSTNQVILRVRVSTTGALSPLPATRFVMKTNGTTNASDITAARMYYTGSSTTFSTATPFGSVVSSPSGTFAFNGSQTLLTGSNYFWLVYDINLLGTPGNVVDAECDTVYVNGVSQEPTVKAPAGSRTVKGIPAASTSPDSLNMTLAEGATATDTVVIRNTGNEVLLWSIGELPGGPNAASNAGFHYLPGPQLPKGAESDGVVVERGPEGQGGPDGAGYVWIDSDEPGGPAFSWVDISISGTQADTAQFVKTGTFARTDEGFLPLPLPFPFPYYGVNKDSVFIGTNGNVMFQRPTGNIFTNAAFPTAGGLIDNHIGVWWDDLNLNGSTSGKIFYGMSGSNFVITYDSIGLFSTPNTPNYTFQIIISPNGSWKCQYLNMGISGGTLTAATIGMENATGTIGLTVIHNAAYMHNNLAIQFSNGVDWLEEDPLSGSVNPGDSAKVVVTFDATSLSAGVYLASLNVATNDPSNPSLTIPVKLTVQAAAVSTTPIAGWNIISNPVSSPVPGDSVRQLYSQALFAYGFKFVPGSGYQQEYRMFNGVGYWEKFPASPSMVTFNGTQMSSFGIPVVAGWNLIGSISVPVDTAYVNANSVPSNIVTTAYYGFGTGGYGTGDAQLLPGKGYWVKTNAPGTLNLGTAGPAMKPAEARSAVTGLNEITIRDAAGHAQTLRFGVNADVSVEAYELPPLPPAEAFDARFVAENAGYGVMAHDAENATLPVSVQSVSYPLTVEWNITSGSYELVDAAGNRTITGTGSMQITNPSVNQFALRLTASDQLPKEFALDQNYPNPFNPTTSIKFALPVESRVTVEVFNALGQRVRTLVNESRAAGYHVAEWNGTGNANQLLGSGVYFVRLDAQGVDGRSFTNLRKMVLMK